MGFIMPETMEVSAAAKSGDGTTQNAAWSKVNLSIPGPTMMEWYHNRKGIPVGQRNLAVMNRL